MNTCTHCNSRNTAGLDSEGFERECYDCGLLYDDKKAAWNDLLSENGIDPNLLVVNATPEQVEKIVQLMRDQKNQKDWLVSLSWKGSTTLTVTAGDADVAKKKAIDELLCLHENATTMITLTGSEVIKK